MTKVFFNRKHTSRFWKETGLCLIRNCGHLEGKMEKEGRYYQMVIQL
jgi:hypothetical protein